MARCNLRTVTFIVIAAAASLAAEPIAARRSAQTAGTGRVPVIVELFTSEGCSSCPPADRVLADLMARQPVDGALVIGLSEHVDYWDHLGWKDPFSNALFSRRQTDYAAHAGGDNIYTPQMIVDGGAELVGSDRAAARIAVRKASAQPKRLVQLAWSAASPGKLEIDVPADGRDRHASRVMLAMTENGLSTRVTRGENNGHTLPHDGVVRRLVELGMTNGSGAYHAVVPVPIDAAWSRAHLHAVVFTQRTGQAITAAGMISFQ